MSDSSDQRQLRHRANSRPMSHPTLVIDDPNDRTYTPSKRARRSALSSSDEDEQPPHSRARRGSNPTSGGRTHESRAGADRADRDAAPSPPVRPRKNYNDAKLKAFDQERLAHQAAAPETKYVYEMANGLTNRLIWFRITSSNHTAREKVKIPASEVPDDVKWNIEWSLLTRGIRQNAYNNRIENFFEDRKKKGSRK